jgi:hypothetical protein
MTKPFVLSLALLGSVLLLASATPARDRPLSRPRSVIDTGATPDWALPLKITSGCPAHQLWAGHGIGGRPTREVGMVHGFAGRQDD